MSNERFQGRRPNNENCDPDERKYQAAANTQALAELKSCSLRDLADPARVAPLLIRKIEEERNGGENQEI